MVNQIFTSRGYISLDFLRGLAAWSVALPHFYMFSGNRSEILDFTTVFAVEVFFILSGFVLGKQLDTCFEQANYRTLKIFYVRRWLRTIPIFIFVLVLISAINQNLFTLRFFEYATFTATWLSIPNLDEYFVPAWSLAVEEWFYLLFPITLVLSARCGWSKSFTVFSFLGLFAVVKLLHAVNDPEYIEESAADYSF